MPMIEPKKSRDTAIGRKGPAYGHSILLRRRLAQSRSSSWVYFIMMGASLVVIGGVIAWLVAPVGFFIIPVGLAVALWGLATKLQRAR